MKKVILTIVIVLLLGVFAFSAWQVVDILGEYREGEQAYQELEQFISIPASSQKEDPVPAETEVGTLETQPEESDSPFPKVDFDALKAINEDVVGWIYIPDTNVNYPILQGDNDDQYLYHLLTGEYNSSGSIFLDADVQADFSGQNSPIYGHNMKNDTMFADVVHYKKQEFFDAHPTVLLMTPEKNYTVHLFSGYVTDSWGSAWDTAFTETGFAQWLDEIQRKSYFTSDVLPHVSDRIVTLSTCSYETGDSRFVVHGVLEEYTDQ